MAGVINTGSHPKALWPGVRAWWGLKYDEHEKEYPACFEEVTSDKAFEEDVQSTGFGLAPRKTEGAPIAYDSHSQGFVSRYTNLTYALGYIVTMEEREDNKYEKLAMQRTGALAFSVNQTIETISANVYNRAFSTSYTGGDAKPLLSATHPQSGISGGTWSNLIATAADLSEAALEDLIIQINTAKNDRNQPIALRAHSLHIHPSNWFEANRILKSTLQYDTGNNAINAVKATNALPGGIRMNHYFTDSDAWFVRTKCPEGLKMQWRKKPMFDQDNDFDTKNAKAATVFRLAVGWTDPRDLYGSAGA